MEFDVVIVPTFAQVDSWRKERARMRGGGVFGQVVTTFDAWIADLWEPYGDGRNLVTPALREAFMRYCVDLVADECDCNLVGAASVAVRCVRQVAGVSRFQEALDAVRENMRVDGLSIGEGVFLKVIARYLDEIHARDLIEPGEATALLAGDSARVFQRRQKVLVEQVVALTWIQEQFFASCRQLDVTFQTSEARNGLSVMKCGVDMRFAFPAGRLAQPGIVADVVCSFDDAAHVVITCTNPFEMADSLEPRLSERDANVRVQAAKPFSQTDFGRAYLACYTVMKENPWDPAALADAARNFFGGLSLSEALKVDEMLRGNRIVRKDDALQKIGAHSECFSRLEQLAENSNAEDHITFFEARVHAAAFRSSAWREEQLSALRRLRSVLSAAKIVGVGMNACAEMLERSSVSVAFQTGGAGIDVLITTQQNAACLPEGSCDVAVLADLTSEDYPVENKEDALSSLFDVLGLSAAESAVERARCEFDALLKLPSKGVVFVRPLADADAAATYPCAMLEELIDAYREDPSNASEVDNPYRIPPVLQDGLLERGEELLFSNARAAARGAAQPLAAELAQPRLDDLTQQAISSVAPVRLDAQGAPLQGMCPSPSQIEVYLECPFLWFVNRRLRVETLDEGFGPLERGSFAHAALEEFYRRFQAEGYAKVDFDTLDRARGLMRDVTRELMQRQYDMNPRSGRLVAASELERREVSALCNQLMAYLDYEAALLPTFHPEYLEYEIDVDHAVDYAGNRIIGKVDRIDVDSAGHAVIIDYKGSVNSDHTISGKTEGKCGKVQTRIYAQAIKRVLGLDVVGALYVSYGRNPTVTGAYDPRVIESAHLPGVNAEKCSCGALESVPEITFEGYSLADLTFGAMLDETEAIIERALERMKRGDIAPHPATAKVCEYCPVLACPNRGA